MATLYWAANGAMPTTATLTKQGTLGASTAHTLMCIAPSSSRPIKVVEWGISLDGSAAATPIQCELVQTDVGISGTGFTAYVASGVQPYDDPNGPASTITLASSGWTTSSFLTGTEGTITATRYGDLQLVAPTNQYVKQWPLGREFQVPVSKFLRVRVTAAAAVNAYCYVIWEE